MRTAYFSICSANYLPYARSLHASLRAAGVTAPFHLFLVDEVAGRFDPNLLGFPCIETRTLGIPHHFDMAARYTIMEMNTAVKPFCIAWLFDQGADAAIYLDPDIHVVRPLEHVEALLADGAPAVLTPHSCAPLEDGMDPDDQRLLRTGAYNLGFAAFRDGPATRRFLAWWGRQLETKCVVDLEAGLFVDQKFMDLAPSYLAGTAILHHPGYNAAYWNLLDRPVTMGSEPPREGYAGDWLAGGQPLHFFHFSGVVPGRPDIFSKHQNRFGVADIGPLRSLLRDYLAALAAHAMLGGVELARIPYFYGHLANGLVFTDDMRRVYAELNGPAPRGYAECFGSDLNSWLTLSPDLPVEPDAPITRLLHEIWRRRRDVQEVFPVHRPEGRHGLARWFLSSGAREHRVPEPLAAAARRSLDLAANAPSANAPSATPPAAILPEAVPGLGIIGYFRTESGLGTGARANWTAARAAGIACTAHLLPTTGFADDVAGDVPLSSAPPRQDCVLIHVNADLTVRLPSLVAPDRLRGRYRIGYWAWELGRFPAEWQPAFDQVDEVWAPSTFAADAFAAATSKPVRVIPHVVQAPPPIADLAPLRAEFGIPPGRLAFLTAFDLNSFIARKNPAAVLRAFQAAFPVHMGDAWGDPVLVVKFHGRHGRAGAFAELCRALAENPRVIVVDAVLRAEAVQRLQAACDIFVSLHRSEGFGLWVAECMAQGRPVVATHYGGTADFLDAAAGMPIGFTLVPVRPGEYPFGEGQRWAEPDHGEAVAALRRLAEDAALRVRLGAAARARVVERLSARAVGQSMAARLAEIRAGRSAAPAMEQVA